MCVCAPRARVRVYVQLVERSIASVCAAHNTEGSTNRVVGVVRLSGILHLDERVAFMEIARQLCR